VPATPRARQSRLRPRAGESVALEKGMLIAAGPDAFLWTAAGLG
jgi:hypothetical protein